MNSSDPMLDHKCNPIAKAVAMGEGRELWLGELTEPIPGYPSETHCLHVTTPFKSVVFGVNLGDMMALAIMAQIMHGQPINPHWLDQMEQVARQKAADLYKQEMIYTLLHPATYRCYHPEAFTDDGTVTAVGRRKRKGKWWPGISVWKTLEEAQEIASHSHNRGKIIFGVMANWERDTAPRTGETWRELLRNADLIQLEEVS